MTIMHTPIAMIIINSILTAAVQVSSVTSKQNEELPHFKVSKAYYSEASIEAFMTL